MPRPSQIGERRKQLLPIVAATFAELGYRRTTTAELGRRCKVRQNILYRLWPDKKAMFVAAIEYVYERSVETWKKLLTDGNGKATAAQRLLRYESEHHGESGLYRIVFAGLSETDDPDIRKALSHMYGRFHRFIRERIAAHHAAGGKRSQPDAVVSAWTIVGLGTVANIVQELDLMTPRRRKRFIADVGRFLLQGVDEKKRPGRGR